MTQHANMKAMKIYYTQLKSDQNVYVVSVFSSKYIKWSIVKPVVINNLQVLFLQKVYRSGFGAIPKIVKMFQKPKPRCPGRLQYEWGSRTGGLRCWSLSPGWSSDRRRTRPRAPCVNMACLGDEEEGEIGI